MNVYIYIFIYLFIFYLTGDMFYAIYKDNSVNAVGNRCFCTEHHTKRQNAEFLALQQLVRIITIGILKVTYTVLTD
jgi:hypothetical protein